MYCIIVNYVNLIAAILTNLDNQVNANKINSSRYSVDFSPNKLPNGQPHPNAGKISTAYLVEVIVNS